MVGRAAVDVAVVGLGAMGSMTLWQLAERGVHVAGFEQFEPGHDCGSSHGESRIIRTAYFEGPNYVPLVQRSFHLWRSLEALSGQQLLIRTGALMIGPPGSELIDGTLRSVREHDLNHQVLDRQAMATRFPQHVLDAGDIAVYEEPAGVLLPEKAVQAAVTRAAAAGASIKSSTPVKRIEPDGDLVRVTAGGRSVSARHVVVSVGAWLGAFLPALSLPLHVTRQVLSWMPVETADHFSPDRFPVFIHQSGDHQWYGFPSLDGATVKLAVHYEGRLTDPDSVDRDVRPEDTALLEQLVREGLRGVEPRAVRNQVCLYTNTPDFHFLVGRAPGAGNVTVLGGFSGHGFKFAPVIGEIAADLVTEGATRHEIAAFSPVRFSGIAR
jgi:sarcosine oxidase